MVYISKVYTRSGDAGQTMLASGEHVSKDAQRIRAYGDVDELNTVIGMIRVEIDREPRRAGFDPFLAELAERLRRVQQELFDLGAELATAGEAKLVVEDRNIERLEREIDGWNDALEPLESFVLPAGGPVGAACHVARTVCRRAEREIVALDKAESVRPQALKYVNRLSDWLFVAARAVAQRLGYEEALWMPKST